MNLRIEKHIDLSFGNSAELTESYRSLRIDYPKFFKMDGLSKLGLLASEMIFKDECHRFAPREDLAVICFNRSSSLETDAGYLATVQNKENYFPSPSLFVYTLPNIVTGEIAIRNNFFGETSFYVLETFDAVKIFEIVRNAFSDQTTNAVLAAWIECFAGKFDCFMCLIEKGSEKGITFTPENILNLKN
jgi:3-oxoacyl-[acyl-carrier-protein] synthase-1